MIRIFLCSRVWKDRPGFEALKATLIEPTLDKSGKLGIEALRGKYLYDRLKNFGQGHVWDAQRIAGQVHREYIPYATVAIGLYASALGLSRDEILQLENQYARFFSDFPKDTHFDKEFNHLPEDNVKNTDIGMSLVIDGKIN